MVSKRSIRFAAAFVLWVSVSWAPRILAEEPAPKDPPAAPVAEKDPFPELTLPPQSSLAKAEKDQWVKARITVWIGEKRQIEVVRETHVKAVETDAKGKHITVETTNAAGGNKTTSTQRYLVLEAKTGTEPADEEKAQPAESVDVGGKKVECAVGLRDENAGGKTIAVKTWRSNQVPMGNFVRIEHDGKAVYELLDFGTRR